ncbi:MAG: hypothetical protein GY778_27860, partial [bacterium]|nr:hypothetical protein [bacterium]
MRAISGGGPGLPPDDDLYVVPDNPPGVVLHRDSHADPPFEWRTIDSGAGVRFYDIQAFDLPDADFTNFVAVGEGGVAYLCYVYWGRVEWYETATGTSEDLVGVYGEWPNNIIAVGAGGSVIRYTGEVENSLGVWQNLNAPVGAAFSAIGARSYNDVFMVGDAGRIVNYDRAQFSNTIFPEPVNLEGVWGGEPGAFAVGDGGTVLRTTEPPPYRECPNNVTV